MMNIHATGKDWQSISSAYGVTCPNCKKSIDLDSLNGFDLNYLGENGSDQETAICPHCETDLYWEAQLHLDMKIMVGD